MPLEVPLFLDILIQRNFVSHEHRHADSMTSSSSSVVRYSGHLHLRTRIVLSILSGKPIRVDGIRSNDKNPGLRGQNAFCRWS